MFLSMSAVVLLGAVIYGLWRFGRLAVPQAVLCALFGFLLASSSIAPQINDAIEAAARALEDIDP